MLYKRNLSRSHQLISCISVQRCYVEFIPLETSLITLNFIFVLVFISLTLLLFQNCVAYFNLNLQAFFIRHFLRSLILVTAGKRMRLCCVRNRFRLLILIYIARTFSHLQVHYCAEK